MSQNTFSHLLQPGKIGNVHLKNRMVKMGAQPGFFPPEPDLSIPARWIEYLESLARGGVALVTIPGGMVDYPPPPTRCPWAGFGYEDDKYIPSMAVLADRIHKYDIPVFYQTMGAGVGMNFYHDDKESIGASALTEEELPMPYFRPPRALEVWEIEHVIEMFVSYAERFSKAGYNGIEINGANNHLINSFLSRAWNKREDDYGCQSLESRTRMLATIVSEIKRRAGKDFAVINMINGIEINLKNGITVEECIGIARILEKAGSDAIEVRPHYYSTPREFKNRIHTEMPDIAMYPGSLYSFPPIIDDSHNGRGGWVPVAARVKRAVSIPVISVGRLDAELGEKYIAAGDIDFINMNRRLMADHEYPNKVMAGKLDDIRPCTGCYTCYSESEAMKPPVCMVNAGFGLEREFEITKVKKPRKVVVVGAGPGGMEAARLAAERGHKVVLFEKQHYLGGSLPLAAMVKDFEHDFLGFARWLGRQMYKLGVDVRLGTAADRAAIEAEKPDVLVLALGGTHNIPAIPGINSKKVVTSQKLHTQLKQFLRFFKPELLGRLTKLWMPVGKNVVIIGGGIHGCQTAAFLIKRGRKVTIVEEGPEIGEGLLVIHIKAMMLDWLERMGAVMLPGVKCERVIGNSLEISDKDGKKQLLAADTIITALPLRPNEAVKDVFAGLAPEIYAVGDCNDPHLTVEAVRAGADIGIKV